MKLEIALSRSGVASRRHASSLIEEGRVRVDGHVQYSPSTEVNPSSQLITIDGLAMPALEPLVYYAFHKPRGVLSTRVQRDRVGQLLENAAEEHSEEVSEDTRRTIYDLLNEIPYRIEPIDRLDFNTPGLMLMTNDGELSHKLAQVQDLPQKFKVKVWKHPDARKLKRIQDGLSLEDGRTLPTRLRVIETTGTNNCWLEILVKERRPRLIHRLFDAVGHPVSKLRRISYSTIALGSLDSGEFRSLTGREIHRLRDIASGIAPDQAGNQQRYKPGYARPKPKSNRPLSRKRRVGSRRNTQQSRRQTSSADTRSTNRNRKRRK